MATKGKKKNNKFAAVALILLAAFLLANVCWVAFSWLPAFYYSRNMKVKADGDLDTRVRWIDDGYYHYHVATSSYLRYDTSINAYNYASLDGGFFVRLEITVGFGGKQTAKAGFSSVEPAVYVTIPVSPENGYMPTNEQLNALNEEERKAFCDKSLPALGMLAEKLEGYCGMSEKHPTLKGFVLSLQRGGPFAAFASIFIIFDIAYASFWFSFRKKYFYRFIPAENRGVGKCEIQHDGLVFGIDPPEFPMFNGVLSVSLPYEVLIPDKLASITDDTVPGSEKAENEFHNLYTLEICFGLKKEKHLRLRVKCPEIEHERTFYIDKSLKCLPDESIAPKGRLNNEHAVMKNRELLERYMSAAAEMWGENVLGN